VTLITGGFAWALSDVSSAHYAGAELTVRLTDAAPFPPVGSSGHYSLSAESQIDITAPGQLWNAGVDFRSVTRLGGLVKSFHNDKV